MIDKAIFEVDTQLDFSVSISQSRWDLITKTKHPIMAGKENTVKDVLQFPDEIRRSRNDPSVYLFYKLEQTGRWICVLVKRMNGNGFIITAYPTDKIKEGENIWSK